MQKNPCIKLVPHDPLNKIADQINDFFILCLYEKTEAPGDFQFLFNKHKLKGRNGFQPYTYDQAHKSFVIWSDTYKENEELFAKLRQAARNETMNATAQTLLFYLLDIYEHCKGVRKNFRKEKHFMEDALYHLENRLKNDTFLGEKKVWEEFYVWFKNQIKEWILEEIITSMGIQAVEKLKKEELNQVFFQSLSRNFSGNKNFTVKLTYIVNLYIQDWIEKVLEDFELSDNIANRIERILGMKKEHHSTGSDMPFPSPHDFLSNFKLTAQEHFLVMNSIPYQSVRDAFYKKQFASVEGSPWPTAPILKGNAEGFIQIIPLGYERKSVTSECAVQDAWNQAEHLSDLDVDVFDALSIFFLANARSDEDIIEIDLNDLLAIRGLKPKLGGEGRRGGYEGSQRRKIMKSLTNIQRLWVDMEKAMVYESAKPVQTKLQGRTFLFKNQKGEEYELSEDSKLKKITFTIDHVLSRYLNGSSRQVALLSTKALKYDPYRQTWEKRLARYLSWRWRTQARKADFLQPNRTSTLLESIGENVNERTPSRTRERFEKALDTLLEDGIIASWHYEKWDESIAEFKGWGGIWLNSTVLIEPPDVIKDQYRSLEKRQKTRKNGRKEEFDSIRERIKSERKSQKLSLTQLAENLDISAPYLSSIERGLTTPSKTVQRKIAIWLEKEND